MTSARWLAGRRNSSSLADDLLALYGHSDPDVSARAGALAVATTINSAMNYLEALAKQKG
jgi:hypothetical protein